MRASFGIMPLVGPTRLVRQQWGYHSRNTMLKRILVHQRRWNSGEPTTATTDSSTMKEASKLSPSEKASMESDSDELEITTGMIGKSGDESLLYFDNVFPRLSQFEQLNWLTRRILRLNSDGLEQTFAEKAIPRNLPVAISKVVTREKDGGVFVRFSVKEDAQVSAHEAEEKIIEHYTNAAYRPWYKPFSAVRVFPVRGTPWIEDLRRAQSAKLKVNFEGADVSQEALYSILRRYGPIIDIVPPAPGDSAPRAAQVTFTRVNDAATARNCVNGLLLRKNDTKLHLSFVPIDHKNAIKEWVVDHPRIVIPILLALFATLAVIIFEPIRVWFINHKVTGKLLALEGYPRLNWFRNQVVGIFGGLWKKLTGSMASLGLWKEAAGSFQNLWDERLKAIDDLKQWVEEGVNTFIVVHGPKGSGKEDLVFKYALKDRNNILSIDFDKLIKARSDSSFIKATAQMLGYYPVFPWMNSITQFLDLAVQGLTGQKSGFAESLDTQFKNMLNTGATALTRIALDKKKPEMSDENYLQLHPENKPVIVLRNLVTKSEEKNAFVYEQVVEWAATLIQANVAHVIVITDDVGYEKLLGESLPNQVLKLLPVGDANAASAKAFVMQQFVKKKEPEGVAAAIANAVSVTEGEKKEVLDKVVGSIDTTARLVDDKKEKQKEGTAIKFDTSENEAVVEVDSEDSNDGEKETYTVSFDHLDEALAPIGGRMTDLQAFARRLKSGETPLEALQDMIEQAKVEVLQMYVIKPSGTWTREQAWTLVKQLATADIDAEKHEKQSQSKLGFFESLSPPKHDEPQEGEAETKTVEISMDALMNDSNFSSAEQFEALSELERAEMISLKSSGGRVTAIRAGKPLYQGAFRALVEDKELNARMEIGLLNDLVTKETGNINKYEKELVELSKLQSRSEIRERVDYLAGKLRASQEKIVKYEALIANQTKLLPK